MSPLPYGGEGTSGYADALTLLRESIEINTTDDTINSVPSQSGRVNATPSKTTDSNALLSGSAQLRMLAFGPPIICAPFRYRLNVSAVPITTVEEGQQQAAVNHKGGPASGVERRQHEPGNQHTPADNRQRAVAGDQR